MLSRIALLAAQLIVGCNALAQNALTGTTWRAEGSVVDENGAPVTDFIASSFWSANGVQWDEAGVTNPRKTDEEIAAYWSNEGVLAPWPDKVLPVLDGGRFEIDVPGNRSAISIFVTDRTIRKGGFCSFEKDGDRVPAKVTLRPLVRVEGQMTCSKAGNVPKWTNAIVHPVNDLQNRKHFIWCGSMHGTFSFLLPPGKYDLQLYGNDPHSLLPMPIGAKLPADMPVDLRVTRISVGASVPVIRLGSYDLELTSFGELQVKGEWGDYTKRYGLEPLPIQFSYAKGVAHDFRLQNLKGKWVLVSFWSFGCAKCVQHCMPELIEFYEAKKDKYSQFEIISICVDTDGTIKSFSDVEKRMDPLVAGIWNGKRPSFPIIVDDAQQVRKSYGIWGMPTDLLIDPDGRLVDTGGNEALAVLREKIN